MSEKTKTFPTLEKYQYSLEFIFGSLNLPHINTLSNMPVSLYLQDICRLLKDTKKCIYNKSCT